MRNRPNILFVLADQWRAQACGYAGDPNVRTPRLDEMADGSLVFTHAVCNTPVCSPYRASLMTGTYPHTNGIFLNDVYLQPCWPFLAECLRDAGYRTGYVGKWHLNAGGRSRCIPSDRRKGFEYWKVLECTHDYGSSSYFADDRVRRKWEGYDAAAQTSDVVSYLEGYDSNEPFFMVLAWGPPHNPYQTAPGKYRRMYDPEKIELRPNVPQEAATQARTDLAGYYAHCSALDEMIGSLRDVLHRTGREDDTLFFFTSDHGDMHGSQGQWRKQQPYDESILAPFLLRWPARFGRTRRQIESPINAPDIMPTILGLCGVTVPSSVEGFDFSGHLMGGEVAEDDRAAVIACYAPFANWERKQGGREYRGIRTERYTYVRSLEGPWLLYDNHSDLFQQSNLAGSREQAGLESSLEALLDRRLEETGDRFLPTSRYLSQWGYEVDERGCAPYEP